MKNTKLKLPSKFFSLKSKSPIKKSFFLALNFSLVALPAAALMFVLTWDSQSAERFRSSSTTTHIGSYPYEPSGFRMGVQIGPSINSGSISGSNDSNLNGGTGWRTRLSGGLIGEYEVNPFFSIATELSYVQRGFTLQGVSYAANGYPESATADFNLNYLDIPVLAKFYLPTNTILNPFAFIGVGPSLLINKSAELKVGTSKLASTDSKALDDYFNFLAPAFHVGIGTEFEVVDRFSILLSARYSHMLRAAKTNSAWSGLSNQTVQFTTGAQFDL